MFRVVQPVVTQDYQRPVTRPTTIADSVGATTRAATTVARPLACVWQTAGANWRVHGQRLDARDVDVGLVQSAQVGGSNAARAVQAYLKTLSSSGNRKVWLVQHSVRREIGMSRCLHQHSQLRARAHCPCGALKVSGNDRLEERRNARLQRQHGAFIEGSREVKNEDFFGRDERRAEQHGHLFDGTPVREHTLYERKQLIERIDEDFRLAVLRLFRTSSRWSSVGSTRLIQFLQVKRHYCTIMYCAMLYFTECVI